MASSSSSCKNLNRRKASLCQPCSAREGVCRLSCVGGSRAVTHTHIHLMTWDIVTRSAWHQHRLPNKVLLHSGAVGVSRSAELVRVGSPHLGHGKSGFCFIFRFFGLPPLATVQTTVWKAKSRLSVLVFMSLKHDTGVKQIKLMKWRKRMTDLISLQNLF